MMPAPPHTKPALDAALEKLRPGESFELPADDRERVIVLLRGACSAQVGDCHWAHLGPRADVFDGPATAIYAPRGQPGRIEAVAVPTAIAVISASARRTSVPFVVRPHEIRIEHRGRGTWAREVHDIVGVEHPADRILLGETFSCNGVWSGYPPHKHDRHDPPRESRLEELFLMQIRPRTGFGIFVYYSDRREHATIVHDGDIVRAHDGYHSFVAAGGHRFYYLWALAGEQRVLRMQTDPKHRWLLEP